MIESDDLDAEGEQFIQDHVLNDKGSVTAVPTLQFYQRRYAYALANNDQKAARLFKEYESTEMVRRFQSELMWVRNGQVLEQTLDGILGKTRRSKYKGYTEWAKLMLLWVSNAKK